MLLLIHVFAFSINDLDDDELIINHIFLILSEFRRSNCWNGDDKLFKSLMTNDKFACIYIIIIGKNKI